MASPFRQFPTLDEAIARAIRQGCELKEIGLVGPRGPIKARCLVRGKVIYPIPDAAGDARLAPAVTESLERALDISLDPQPLN